MNKRMNLNTTRQRWGKNPVLVSKVGGSGMKTLYWGRLLLVLGMVLTLTLTVREAQGVHEIRPVVLVHGINTDEHAWDDTLVKTVLEACRGPWNVYVVDTLTVTHFPPICFHGRSIGQLTIELWAYLYLSGLLYDYGEFDFVAHSMGGLVCREFLRTDPERHHVRSLTMLATPNIGTTGTLWLELFLPCAQNDIEVQQMKPGSYFLTTLNDFRVSGDLILLSLINRWDEVIYIGLMPFPPAGRGQSEAAWLLNSPPLDHNDQCINLLSNDWGRPWKVPPWEWPFYHHTNITNDPAVELSLKYVVQYAQPQALKGTSTTQATAIRYSFDIINENEIGWINQVEIRCNDPNAIIESPPEWTGIYDDGVIRWTCSNRSYYITSDEPDNTFSYISEIPPPPLTWRLSVPGAVATLEQTISPSGRLGEGWNVISIPLAPPDAEASSVLDDIWPVVEDLYRHEPNVDYERYPEFTYMQHGAGYYLRLGAEGVEILSGIDPETDMEIALAEGWNLIGHPFVYPVQLEVCQVSDGAVTKSMQEARDAGWVLARIYFYDENTYKIVNIAEPRDDDSLRPWYGYWILARQPELTLVVPSSGGAMSAGAEGKKETTNDLEVSQVGGNFNLCIYLDANNCTSWDFHAGIETGASDGNDLLDMPAPPLPPPGLTEVRFTTEVAPQGPQMYDYRPPPPTGSSKIWNATAYSVNFQSGQCKQVTMTWDLTMVDRYCYELVNLGSGEIIALTAGGEYSFEICEEEALPFELTATLRDYLADLDCDGDVDLLDLGEFVMHWLESDCGPSNGWCGGASLNDDETVNMVDFAEFAKNWLVGTAP